MKISKLVEILEERKTEHGDLNVQIEDYIFNAYCNLRVKEIVMISDSKNKKVLCLNHV